MSEALAVHELAKRLVARPANDATLESQAFAAQVACDRACRTLARSVGAIGFQALLRRALAQAQQSHPLLETIKTQGGEPGELMGVQELVAVHGAPAVSAALEALLEALLGLLARLTGVDIVAQLVDRSPPPANVDAEDLK